MVVGWLIWRVDRERFQARLGHKKRQAKSVSIEAKKAQ